MSSGVLRNVGCLDELAARGGAAFREELSKLDEETASSLFDGDSQRLVRAMGVVRATGRPISAWQSDPHQGALAGEVVAISVMPPRADTYARIDRRFAQMMEEGAVCLLYTSPSPRDQRGSRMPSSA